MLNSLSFHKIKDSITYWKLIVYRNEELVVWTLLPLVVPLIYQILIDWGILKSHWFKKSLMESTA